MSFYNKLYKAAKRAMPSISETEQTALNAGDCWYEQQIFQGKPNFDQLHQSQKFELSTEEKDFLNNETVELCEMLDDWQITQDNDLPEGVWNFLREKGFFGIVIRKDHGGKGFSAAAHSEIVMKIATRSPSAAVTVMVPNSLGPGELLHHYGTDEQKSYYLPRLANGQEIPCFALTGPTAGSDATSLPDKGTVCYGDYKGEKVLGIKLENINKRYITLAPVATLVGLAFNLQDPDNLLGENGKVGITCALLPHDHEGLEIGKRLYPLKQAFMNGVIRCKESFIPMDWIIGGQSMAGEGWRMLVECLSIGRAISLPACGTANALFSTTMTSSYSLIREQFKTSIGNFEGVAESLGKMGGLTYMMNATRQFTVASVDAGIRPSVASAIAKYHLTENGRTVLNHAMDVHAGRAVIAGPNNYLVSAYQAVPVGITVEGANIMTRNLMIFGQGAMRCHPYVRDEAEALMSSDESKGQSDFIASVKKHVKYYTGNVLRTIWQGFTCGATATGYNSEFNKYYKRISRLSTAYACISDISLATLGGSLKVRERISARLGDVMSYLYMACATLKLYKDRGEVAADKPFVIWSLEHCIYEAQSALIDTLDNFYKSAKSNKRTSALAKTLKFVVFPYGAPYKQPSDKLELEIARSLLSNSDTRKYFRDMCYVPHKYDDIVGRMEVTFDEVLASTPVVAKIKKAIKSKELPKDSAPNLIDVALEKGIITQQEHDVFSSALVKTNEVIQTDEFDDYALGPKNAHPQWAK